jgi:hypothetical protein
MLALDTGQIWWSHDASSFRAIGLDDGALYVATADGEVVSLRRRTGTEIWRQKALLHRRLSAVVDAGTSVVTADYQGYVHWLDKATGALAARASTGKVRISNAPLVVGNMVLVVNDAGKISAFRMTPIGGKRPATPSEAGTAVSPSEPTSTAPAGAAAQGAASDSTAPPPSGSASAPAGAQPAAPPPQPDDHASSVPAPAPGPEPAAPASPSNEPMAPAPESTAPAPEAAPGPGPAPPAPGTSQPPLPSQPTPDPLPPQPQTQPQPPPS